LRSFRIAIYRDKLAEQFVAQELLVWHIPIAHTAWYCMMGLTASSPGKNVYFSLCIQFQPLAINVSIPFQWLIIHYQWWNHSSVHGKKKGGRATLFVYSKEP